MTDREMLELAAKASGVPAYWSVDGTVQNRPLFVVSAGGGMGTMPYEYEWNPLKDDALAFRLIAQHRLAVDYAVAGYVTVRHAGKVDSHPIRDNPAAATRRSVTTIVARIEGES